MWFCCSIYQRFKTDTMKVINPNLHVILTLSPPSIYQKSQTPGSPPGSISSWSSQHPPFAPGTLHYVPFPSTAHLLCLSHLRRISLQITSTCLLHNNIHLSNPLKCPERLLTTNSLVSISTLSSDWTCFSLVPILPINFHSFSIPPLIPELQVLQAYYLSLLMHCIPAKLCG